MKKKSIILVPKSTLFAILAFTLIAGALFWAKIGGTTDMNEILAAPRSTLTTQANPYTNTACYINVLDFGAVPNDGIDDYSAIQAAEDYRNLNGGALFFVPGVYEVSAPIVVHDHAFWKGVPITPHSIDWSSPSAQYPSYGKYVSVIQRMQGSNQHGPILAASEDETEGHFEGLCFRCGQQRGGNNPDILMCPPFKKSVWHRCYFSNLDVVFKNYAPIRNPVPPKVYEVRFNECRVAWVDLVFDLYLYDSLIADSVFTAVKNVLYKDGAGNRVVGNRFEWSPDYPLYLEGVGDCMITGNEFDSNATAGICVKNAKNITITGNTFRRNGWAKDAANPRQTHIDIFGKCEGVTITGNTFRWYYDDDGKTGPRPDYLIRITNGADSKIRFIGNDTCGGFRKQPFKADPDYWGSPGCMDIDSIDFADGFPGDPTQDTLAKACSTIDYLLFPGHHCVLRIYSDRIATSNFNARKVFLVGIQHQYTSSSEDLVPVRINMNAHFANLDRAHNITFFEGNYDWTIYDYSSSSFASCPPPSSITLYWRNGKKIFKMNSSNPKLPAFGDYAGWINAFDLNDGHLYFKEFGAIQR